MGLLYDRPAGTMGVSDRRTARVSYLIALALAAGLTAAPQRSPEQLAADLGSPVFAVRESAGMALWRLGDGARPALEAAAKSADAEAVRRAAVILDRFDWGLFADTPPAVRDLVRTFQGGVPAGQHAALAGLIRADALPTVRRLLVRRYSPDERRDLSAFLVTFLRREVPPLVVAGDRDRAGERLALHAFGDDPEGLLDLTLFEHLRGKPEPTAPASARLAMFRHRAGGNLPAAVAAADGFPGYRDLLLEDAGDWATLADRPVFRANSGDGLKAFRLRLAGRAADADALLAEQPGLPVGPPRMSANQLDEPTLALVLNDRVPAAVARLGRQKSAPHLLADWLAAQLRFADALKLVADGGPDGEINDPFFRGLYGTRRGRLLSQLGRRAEATAAFEAANQDARAVERETRVWRPDSGYPLEQLIRAEVRAGRFDLACAHLGAAVDDDRERVKRRPVVGKRPGAFEALFEADAEVGEALLGLVAPVTPAGDGLTRVRALLAGKGDPDDVDAVAAAKRPVPKREADRAMVAGQAVAAALRAADRGAEAVAVLGAVADALPPADDAPPPLKADGRPAGPRSWVYHTDERARFWVEFGDALTALGRHADAADRLFQGWQRFPDNPTLLFLSGRALAKAGRAADGQERMRVAHWVALGNPGPRGRFLEELTARGLVAEADYERPLAVRAGWVGGPGVGNVWNQAAKAASLSGDFPAAAHLHRRQLHFVLKTETVYFMDGSAYLTVPQGVAAAEARGLLAAGKLDAAVAAADASLAVLPGNTDLAVTLVTGLDKAGRRADADRLFRRAWDALRAVVAAHPETAWGRAEAAWLAAGCRRELDAAHEYATWAVEHDPDGVLPRKALAEVRFRRGDRAGAVAVMTGLAADDRLSHVYRRQLDRYRTASPDAPPPDDIDE